MLKVESLTKFYGKFPAVRDVSFEVKRGSTTLLIGPNGAGKTTVIKCIIGLLHYSGKITFDGMDCRDNSYKVRSMIGYVPQQSAYYENLTVLDHAKLIAELKKADISEVRDKLEMMRLWENRRMHVKSLSSGMRQRLGIALALINDPPFLIFDEPTSNVDVRGQIEFESKLQEFSKQGKTVLTTTHLSGLGEYADEAVILDSGRVIASGNPRELLARINALDVIHIRLDGESVKNAVNSLAKKGIDNVIERGEWIEFSVQPAMKLSVINYLLQEGFNIDDVIIEPRRIESEYLKLLREEGKN